MKFLTICFVMWYVFLLFKMKDNCTLINKVNNIEADRVDSILTSGNSEEKATVIGFVVYGILAILLNVIEVFYMFFALSYLPKIIGIGYILFWIYVLVVSIARSKKNKNKQLKLSIKSYIFNIIDLLYYINMINVLFL